MSQLLVKSENFIEPKQEIIKNHLLSGDYILCCNIEDLNDMGTLIIENVICVKKKFREVHKPFFIEYTVTNDPNKQKYSLHDDIVILFTDNEVLDKIIANILRTYSLYLLDDNNIDRNNIYGKLGTKRERSLIFRD